MTLEFEPGRTVKLDGTMMFGTGYDFFGLEHPEEAVGKTGKFLLWRRGDGCPGYSLYRDTDGGFCNYDNYDDAVSAAEQWDTEELEALL